MNIHGNSQTSSSSGIINSSDKQQSVPNTPRSIIIKKSNDGFGFNVRGQVFEGGQIKAIHGKLYGPLQHISAISNQSSAEKAGLSVGDKILQVYVV
jgi:sorting nexin-27